MLNGGWGTGKSYYIKNQLEEFLKDEDKKRTVVVSLYGLKEVSEISKSIYLEMRLLKHNILGSEKARAGILAGKTLIKGVASFFNVDLNADVASLQSLYESIDLSGKLIILEDIERSEIDILQLLGYVNSLVEQDNVKVLLVANEEEILNYTNEEREGSDIPQPQVPNVDVIKIEQIPTEATKQYLRTKEKTVSDTIKFENDYYAAIKAIITSFESDVLNRFLDDEELKELQEILSDGNLRSFIFACQKMIDLYEKITSKMKFDDSLIKAMFFGIILFSQALKRDEKVGWNGDSNLSLSFGGIKYPLFKFCYDYITKHEYSEEDVIKNTDVYKDLQLYNRDYANNFDEDIAIITYYYQNYEKDVRQAIKNVEARLLDPKDISYFSYRGLARSLIQISRILDIDITKCKENMIANLHGLGNKLNEYLLFGSVPIKGNLAEEQEWEELKEQMVDALRNVDEPFLGFDYTPKTLEKFYMEALRDDRLFNEQQPFSKNLNMDKLSDMLFQCSPNEIEMIRGIFLGVYRLTTIKEYLSCDKDAIVSLLEKVRTISSDDRFDRIQRIQIDWFIKNLEDICVKLNNEETGELQ